MYSWCYFAVTKAFLAFNFVKIPENEIIGILPFSPISKNEQNVEVVYVYLWVGWYVHVLLSYQHKISNDFLNSWCDFTSTKAFFTHYFVDFPKNEIIWISPLTPVPKSFDSSSSTSGCPFSINM